jgi:hypothetical protein
VQSRCCQRGYSGVWREFSYGCWVDRDFFICHCGGGVWWCAHQFWETFTEAPLSLRKDVSHQLLNLLCKILPQTDELDWNLGNKWLPLMVMIEPEIFCFLLFFELAPWGLF